MTILNVQAGLDKVSINQFNKNVGFFQFSVIFAAEEFLVTNFKVR